LARYEFAVQYLQALQPQLVLDAACGVGYGTKLLAESLGTKVLGIDRSEESLAIAGAQFSYPNVTFLRDDCHSLAQAQAFGPFDAVVSFETLEHLPKPHDFLKAVHSVLRTDGIFVVSTPNGLVTQGNGSWEYHEKEYTSKELLDLLKTNGFRDIELLGQQYNLGGVDRNELRVELLRIRSNPFFRLGTMLQRLLRGRHTDTEILAERAADFEFVPFDLSSVHPDRLKKMFVLVACCRK
jgi:cyclopropane fatty-acyl-phospholipid synthase-like methyltransferase